MTDFLFATPSFLGDMGRVIDLGNTLTIYNYTDSPAEADKRALCNDWSVVGSEIRNAAKQAEA
ncbi:MAG: hypothetical protein LBT23_06440 [Synergistaceae bacterium]|jgi:hypothetical protein|nr:hypothetical protein [Synergistaceae bacterium]